MDRTILDRLAGLELEAGELIDTHERGRDPREFRKYRDDPVAFMRAELGFEPWHKQVEVAEAVLRHKKVAVRGHHGAGKDAVLAALMLWACYARGMLVVAISATERQLIGQLWAEMARMWTASGQFPGVLYVGNLRIGGERRVNAMTSGSTSNLTGWHDHKGGGTFVAISESQAEAVGDAAFDAAAGNAAAEGSRIVVVGNPIEPAGRFYEASRNPTWCAVRISAFDHPNICQGKVVIPGGPAPDWPEEIAGEHGESSAFYVSRVLGEFPAESSDAAIPLEAIEAAFQRYGDSAALAELEKKARSYWLGVDPAGPGEDWFAVTVWRGPLVVDYHRWRRLEAPESAEKIVEILRELRRGPVARLGRVEVAGVCIDEIGIGHGLVGVLKRLLGDPWEWPNTKVLGVNVSKKPGDTGRFVRRKCELIWRLREDLVEGRVAFAPNDKLFEELRELRVRQTPDGKIEAEPKDEMRRRLGRSPDVLDSLLVGMSHRVPDGARTGFFRLGIA